MSRSAATPPPTYFPQRNATPSQRHGAPVVKATLFQSRHHQPRRKSKVLHDDSGTELEQTKVVAPEAAVLSLSLNDLESRRQSSDGTSSSFDSHSVEVASTSAHSSRSSDDLQDSEFDMTASISAPSMTSSSTTSFMSTPLPTPNSSRAPSLLQPEIVSDDVTMDDEPAIISPSPRVSWVPYFGKMAKAVVNTGISMGHPFFDKKKESTVNTSLIRVEEAFQPPAPAPKPTHEELARLPEEAANERRNAWASEQQRRVTECARLCSQWPQSGYNQSKWGPHGSRLYYEPQSYANPGLVAVLMARQADLEKQLCQTSGLHFSCYRQQRSSSQDTEPSMDSDDSTQTSPTASMTLSANLSAAIESSMIPQSGFTEEHGLTDSPNPLSSKSLKPARSVSELDTFANSMAIDASAMDLDRMAESTSTISSALGECSGHSCGSKRPLGASCDEEDKRRRVDEAMVVDEAVESGVIAPKSMPTRSTTVDGRPMSASVPDLSSIKARPGNAPAVYGHIVKTSDTHPIIISPFFPDELLPTIARHVVVPAQLTKSAPLLLASKIDVPSLLLSFVPPARHASTLVPSPVQSAFQNLGMEQTGAQLGNLLLSSCPGKRLRMDGPVKGRGPVCRDLATDLRRIKSEGVGCLVCCLDDPELALLGVPWETYRRVAHNIGLDVIRLPMPDGFTPVSIPLFDSQISLIATEYSLKGINVLVHCRGGVGRAGLTACAWAIKMGFVAPHPSLAVVEDAVARRAIQREGKSVKASKGIEPPSELEHQIIMSVVERVIAMIRARRGLKAIESFEQVQFLASYTRWIRASIRESIREETETN